ncbi:MAG TPA: DUF3575 domain-containing protein [Flavobacteriales bacterium]|nr:DUF3575 domain-containing protein [Flavobacteriales bacterium]
MKKTTTILFATVLAGAVSAQSKQISAGADVMLPMGDFGKEFTMAVGPSVGFELPVGDKLALTAQATYGIMLLKDDIKEVLNSATLIPLQAGVKYYFQGSQNGLYAHAQVGVHMFSEKFKENALFGLSAETESQTRTSFGGGIGYQMDKLDFGLRYNMLLAGEEEEGSESDGWSYVGLRVAYLFALGN